MKWYKIKIDFEHHIFGDSISFINYLSRLLYLEYKLDINKIGIFSKMKDYKTYTVYFSETAFEYLLMDLIRYTPVECPKPSKDDDEDGEYLRFHYGNRELLY